jgi:transcriptional regulator with XRE-family HTH domain
MSPSTVCPQHVRVPPRDRRRARATARARALGIDLAREIGITRRAAGLSQSEAGRVVGMSHSEWGRIERGDLEAVTFDQIARAGAAVGLKLWARLYPDGDPIRDAAHARLLERLRSCVRPPLEWRPEVRLPDDSDRSWDSGIAPPNELIGVEAETRITDGQSTWRKVQSKRADDPRVRHVILLVADTRNNRRAMALIRASLRGELPLDTRAVLRALREGVSPGASGIVFL